MEKNDRLHCLAGLLPEKGAPVLDWIRDWVGPRAGLDVVAKRKYPQTRTRVIKPVASHFTD